MSSPSLEFQYEQNRCVRELRTRIRDCLEGISLAFDDYGKEHVRGPGLYFAIVSNRSVDSFADAMGANTWPVERCHTVHTDLDSFYEAVSTVARTRDGGVCVSVDGTVLEQMVRFTNVRDEELPEGLTVSQLEYPDWMGARHMSAYETSLRPDVVATLTLSEESGRVTEFQDGIFDTATRDTIGEPWRGKECE